jgi:xanthine dehydrogenase accessory factor
VSIAAEIVALQWGGGGERLQHGAGPIHHHAEPTLDDADAEPASA